ncbi:MAG TPA: sigma-70 family RNA polymerase sigma factor [Pyrinomonadaceae bacterium]|nr:sigma-70 family RNA polymerase sigma factor [Pyrinomonadaceae bacterium]
MGSPRMMDAPTGASTMALAIEMHLPEDTVARNQSALGYLIERAAAGDHAAFEQIMIHSQQRVMAMSWRMLGNDADARDASQEVFLRVYKYLKRYDQNQDFFAWLYRITVNVCRDVLRKRMRQADRIVPLESDAGIAALDVACSQDDSEQILLSRQRHALIGQAIATLPHKERASILLRDVEGFSTEAVAEILQSSATTVRSQISSARKKIRDYCRRCITHGGIHK